MISLLLGLTAAIYPFATADTCTCTSGTFTALTINVAGLPAILNGNGVPGDKSTNSRLIGSKFAEFGYDVIHVQEDFNYHDDLYATDNHPFRTSTSGPAGLGSGLNTLAGFPWTEFTRVRWNTCSDASGFDCLTPKGFTFMRMSLSDGVFLDLYNLHTDAGTEDGDEAARTSNIQQVVDYISNYSIDNAVLLFGDTNSRYTRSADNIAILTTQAGLTDAWLQLEHNNTPPPVESDCTNPSTDNSCETVDKVFFRSNTILSLSATAFTYASQNFLQPNGDILTDHNPVAVSFSWSLSSNYRQSDLWPSSDGVSQGPWFNDLSFLQSPNPQVLSLQIDGTDSSITAIVLTLASGQILQHNMMDSSPTQTQTLTLSQGEHWATARICHSSPFNTPNEPSISSILVTTSTGQILEMKTQGDDTNCMTFKAKPWWQIVGLMGRQTEMGFSQLGFIYALI